MKVFITKLIRFFKLISLAYRLSKKSKCRETKVVVSDQEETNEIVVETKEGE